MAAARLIVVMGVSGSGKSTVGKALARRLHAPFIEGDDYHPPANLEKMRAGLPLTDDDRWPWLKRVALALHEAAAPKGVAVGSCSALRRAYREAMIEAAGEPILWAYLRGDPATIAARLAARPLHFMPSSLLDSQFATLEAPEPDETALTLDVTLPAEILAASIADASGHRRFKRGQ
jgi:gluconokinase